MSYIIFALVIVDFIFSLLRVIYFYKCFQTYQTISIKFYAPYSLIPLVVWITAQAFLFELQNDCINGWCEVYVMTFIWVVFIYIVLMAAVVILIAKCAQAFVVRNSLALK
eukprot:TRINITY_DN2665_c0_g1_i5.p2 TRINITY_DN2665_c0_g1~~TRINITY_DN2665_c0_g1_i5.p2  ORF type:complete len:110 (+),score=10.93 TRINITY_DN2665_c0_g1_i5:186-515(+)